MDLTVVVPLYNEEESLKELNDWIERVMQSNHFSYEIIYVDDGSSDSSWKVINELSKSNKHVKGVRFRRNYGKSAALNEGFKAAKGNVVITLDADLQDSAEEIPELYRMIVEEGYDMVSGWKKKRHDPITKTIPSRFYNWTTRKLTGIKLHDMNCGLKAYKNELVKNIEVYGEMHRYIPIIAKWEGYGNIGEKVVQHQKRKFGVTKFGLDRFVKGYLDLLTIIFVSKFGQRPMHFFGTFGSLIFMIGFAIALYLAYTKFFDDSYTMMTERPLFFFGLLAMIIGTQLFLTGFLADLVSRNNVSSREYQIKDKININNSD
jgi:glycosyltransferase involved in cell wall biosynthesis